MIVPGSHRSARLNRPGFMKFLFLPPAERDKSTYHVLRTDSHATPLFKFGGRFNRGCTRDDDSLPSCVDWIHFPAPVSGFFLTAAFKEAVFFF